MSIIVSESPPELISVAQAAARFGVHPATIRDWLKRGEIKTYARALGRVRTFVDAREIERKLRPEGEAE